jgi:hypothetical protein
LETAESHFGGDQRFSSGFDTSKQFLDPLHDAALLGERRQWKYE